MGIAQALQRRGADGSVAIQTLALLPPLAMSVWLEGVPLISVLAASLGVVLAWDYVFAALRHRAFKPHGITTAAIFTLFVPPDMPMWHLVVVLSLGTVIGEHVFGGRGFAFLSPATVALALGLLSLPNMVLASPEPVIALACIPGAVLLMAFGMLSVQIVLAFLGTLVLAYGAATPPEILGLITASSVGLVFLVGDPTSAAVTGLGRVLYGAFAGGLVWIFGGLAGGGPAPDALAFAALLASLFAPLIDNIVVSLNTIWRRRRYG